MKSKAWLRHFRSGQGSVEAACMIPVLFVMMLLLVQPSIVLYDRIVMESAAAEGCRLLATKNGVAGDMTASCEAFIRHRLSSVPPQSCFHIHEGSCSWNIQMEGDESSDRVKVVIENQVKPLPLLDVGCTLLGLVNGEGNLVIRVERTMTVQPDWVAHAPAGQSPAYWPGAWS